MNGTIEKNCLINFGKPKFTEGQIEKELKQVMLLDRILAKNGPLTFNRLYDLVEAEKESFFQDLNDLKTFVKLRTNIFEESLGLVRNRSQEFRKMFKHLVNFLSRVDSSKLNVTLVWETIYGFDLIVLHEVGSTENTVRQFLESHKNFFIMCNSDAFVFNPACLQIPSAWEPEALPLYETGIRYDKSIVLNELGKVVTAVVSTQYVKIEIVRGPWTKQTVYGRISEENWAVKYPVGTLVKVVACRAYHAAHLWTAMKVVSADTGSSDIRSLRKTERVENMLTKSQYRNNGTSRSTASSKFTVGLINEKENGVTSVPKYGSEEKMKMSSSDWKFYDDLIHDEIKKIGDIDYCLRNGPKTFHQIFDELIERDTFAYYSYMINFIQIHTHLYEISDNLVRMRSNIYRTEMLKFLRYIDVKSNENITLSALRQLVKDNDGNFVEDLVKYAEKADTFLNFIEEHLSIIELAEAFGEQFVFLRGTFVTDCNIFMPKFHFSQHVR